MKEDKIKVINLKGYHVMLQDLLRNGYLLVKSLTVIQKVSLVNIVSTSL